MLRFLVLLLFLLFAGEARALSGVFPLKEKEFQVPGVGKFVSGRSEVGKPFVWFTELAEKETIVTVLGLNPLTLDPKFFIVPLDQTSLQPKETKDYVLVGFQFPQLSLTEFAWVKKVTIQKMVTEMQKRIELDKALTQKNVAYLN